MKSEQLRKLDEGETIHGPMIYRKGAIKGQILFWAYDVQEGGRKSRSGVVGGKTEYSEWTQCEPKNVGKSNETDANAQALAEAEAQMEKKIKRGGYHLSIDDLDNESKFFVPMTAHKYRYGKDIVYKGALPFPVFYQPKLNGTRCTISKDRMLSRYGEEVVSCPHIRKALTDIFKVYPKLVIDGELYNHDLREQLNKLMSLVRKQTPTAEELEESENTVQFHIYDADFGNNFFFSARYCLISNILGTYKTLGNACVHLVPTKKAHSPGEIDALFANFVDTGYEGGMVRLDKFPYEHKRSRSLLKDKPRQDAEYEILYIEEGKGKRLGMAARIVCRLPKTALKTFFSANVKWTDEEKKRIWRDRLKYRSTLATVSFAYLTNFGVPFHAYVEALHLDSKRKF